MSNERLYQWLFKKVSLSAFAEDGLFWLLSTEFFRLQTEMLERVDM